MTAPPRPSHVLITHPSPDLYGSDLQMVSAAQGLIDRGWRVTVALPAGGPLSARLDEIGAVDVRIDDFPVLRKALMSPRGLIGLVFGLPRAVWRLVGLVRAWAPDVVYVNTVTIPWWVLAARLARVPVVVHVHEAEDSGPRLVRWALAAPLLLAQWVVTNSQASKQALLQALPRLARHTSVIYNGIAGPPTDTTTPDTTTPDTPAAAEAAEAPARLVLVARLSARKGVDVALEALAQLRRDGRAVELDICGTVYPGYEDFEAQLHHRAAQPDLAGAVHFHGYVNPTWPILTAADIVLIPSRTEPFGNTAVEGLLAARPVIASRVQGLQEIITHNHTGLLVEPGNPHDLAHAITTLLDNPTHAHTLATTGHTDALNRFAIERYRDDVDTRLHEVAGSRRAGSTTGAPS